MKQAVQPEDRKRERVSTEFEQGWLPVSGVMMLGRWPKPNGVPHILISRKVKKVYSNHNTTTATLARAGGADVHWRFPEESSQAQQADAVKCQVMAMRLQTLLQPIGRLAL